MTEFTSLTQSCWHRYS